MNDKLNNTNFDNLNSYLSTQDEIDLELERITNDLVFLELLDK